MLWPVGSFPYSFDADPSLDTFLGGRQPYAPMQTAFTAALDANVPPSTIGGPAAVQLALAALAQPDPWAYELFGAGQPYAPRQISPAIPGQDRDNPPSNIGGPVAISAAVIATGQPDPWVYSFQGAAQPYGASRLSAGIPGQDVRFLLSFKGPFATSAELAGLSQPDPWVYAFAGARQPYAGFTWAAPLLSGMAPPPAGASNAIAASLISFAQPDPWTYSFAGARQPDAGLTSAAQVSGVAPPLLSKALAASQVTIAQPDPWTYSFEGATQPYAPARLSAAIPGQDVRFLPGFKGPFAVAAELVALTQPDPWSYSFVGAAQPYAGVSNAASNLSGMFAPVAFKGPITIAAELVALAQPDPWTYCTLGAAQPYAGSANVASNVSGMFAPIAFKGPVTIATELVALAQPDPWTYSYFGTSQPFGAKTLSPAIPGQSISNTTFVHPARSVSVNGLLASWQLDPWCYTYFGAFGPYMMRRPGFWLIPAPPVPSYPTSGTPGALVIRAAWDPPAPDVQLRLTSRLEFPQGDYLAESFGAFALGGVAAMFSILQPSGGTKFLGTGNAATLTRTFVNWLPKSPISAVWTPDNAMSIPDPESE